jgi:hypothetical protein
MMTIRQILQTPVMPTGPRGLAGWWSRPPPSQHVPLPAAPRHESDGVTGHEVQGRAFGYWRAARW